MARVIILRALRGYPDSRVEKEAYSLSKKYDVTVFGWDREHEYKGYKESYVKVFDKTVRYIHTGIKAPIGLGFKKLLVPELRFWMSEYKYLKNNIDKYDIIHACDFDTAFIAAKIAKKYKKKVVYDIFDYYAESHQGPRVVMSLIERLDRNVIENSDAVIICSELRRQQIKAALPKQLYVIHNTPMEPNNSLGGKITKRDSKMIKLVYVGLLSKDRYLEEIAEVIESKYDIEWHVGGWGVLDNYFKNISQRCKKIIYYGELPYLKTIKLESECDIMTALYDPTIPNHKYAAPNKFYEALMLDKPLIVIKGTGMDSYVSEYGLGEVIDLNKNDFKTEFSKALDNLILRIRSGEIVLNKNRQLYESEFSWEIMEGRLYKLYDNL